MPLFAFLPGAAGLLFVPSRLPLLSAIAAGLIALGVLVVPKRVSLSIAVGAGLIALGALDYRAALAAGTIAGVLGAYLFTRAVVRSLRSRTRWPRIITVSAGIAFSAFMPVALPISWYVGVLALMSNLFGILPRSNPWGDAMCVGATLGIATSLAMLLGIAGVAGAAIGHVASRLLASRAHRSGT